MSKAVVATEEVRKMDFEYRGQRFFLREPTGPEIVECENVKSEAWFTAVKNGVPGEEEILDTLEEQGRFNREKHQSAIDELDEKLASCLTDIAQGANEEIVSGAYKQAQKIRKKMLDMDRRRQSYVLHSAEQKSENAYYLSLFGLCVYSEVEINGRIENKYHLSAINEDIEKVDVAATYRKVTDWNDPNFITYGISHFIPFLRGYRADEIKMPEDLFFDNRIEALRKGQIIDQSTPAPAAIEEVAIEVAESLTEPPQLGDEIVTVSTVEDKPKIETFKAPAIPKSAPAPAAPAVAVPTPEPVQHGIIEAERVQIFQSTENVIPVAPVPSKINILPIAEKEITEDNQDEFYKTVLSQQGGSVDRLGDASGKRVLDALPSK